MKLGILTSHPIQYQAPWFRALAEEVDLEAFFAHRPDANQQGEGFGKAFEWDVDLTSGYHHTFLKNVARHPALNRFYGCDTPEIASIIRGQRTEGRGQNEKAKGRRQKAEIQDLSAFQNVSVSAFQASAAPSSTLLAPRSFDCFIVSGWHLKSYWQAIRACRQEGVPVFVRGDSQLRTPRSSIKRLVKELVYRVLLRRFDGFLFVGQRNREYLLHYGAQEKRLFHVPHFVDNKWFRQKAEIGKTRKAEIRKEWGIPEDAFCILFVGKFVEKKRPGDLLRALALLRDKAVEAIGVFVGAGELEPRLRTDAQRLCVAAKFVGFKNQSELPACYASADVLVLPSDGGETWGLVVNEAMACGLPAIVSDAVGCAPDLIEEGKTGYTFPLGDVDALADRLYKIRALMQDGHDFTPALKTKLQRYGLDAAVAGTLEAIKAQRAKG